MKTFIKYITTSLVALMAFTLIGCSDGPAEKAGEKVDNAAEQTQDAAQNAVDNTQDAAETAGDKIENATN